MKFLNIKPCDDTFFRDGHQFEFGINNFIRSKNVPYPSVFFGAIFTAILSQNDLFRKTFFTKGRYDHEEILKLHQFYIFNNTTKMAYIHAPKDLFVNSNGEKIFGKFEKIDNKLVSIPYRMMLKSPEDNNYERADKKYINVEDISYYEQEIGDPIELIDENKIFIKNNKTGIKIDKRTGTVEESMLYKMEQTEFCDDVDESYDWSYLVEYEICNDYLNRNYSGIKIQDLDKGYLKLGGENKVCRFERIKDDYIGNYIKYFTAYKKDSLSKGIYKIVFTSDTFFKENIDKAFGDDIKILGMANDKPVYIGGYDMEKFKAQKMYKGYPAGTVVLIEVLNRDTKLNIKSQNSKGFNEYIVLEGSYINERGD